MASQEILSELKDATLAVTFNRPAQRNALNLDICTQLFNLLKTAATNRSIRAIVLQGQGGNFMDGVDMKMFAGDFTTSLEHYNQLFQPYHSAIRELYMMDKPIIGIAQGQVAGPGLSFLVTCDFVVAAKSAEFNTRFASYGTTPDGGLSYGLTRKAGVSKATELLMLAETFSSADAQRYNLVNRVVEDEVVLQEGHNWAHRLASGPTRAYAGIKRLVSKAFEQEINSQLASEHSQWGAVAKSFDLRDAMRASSANRPPKFTGS